MSSAIAAGFRRRQTARSIASTSSDKQPPPAKPFKPVTLARRLLFPHVPLDGDLPPLLLSQSIHPELNAELYDLIAISLRAYVHPWWTKITRYDKEFLPAITRVLTSIIRTIETRLVRTDLSPLFLRDLPILLTQHVVDYRNARSKLHSSYAIGGSATLAQLFHQMQPHIALSAEGTVDETYIRQAVDELLRACFPTENYEPEAERYIVREIILKVLLDGVIPRVTQPWFIHQTILTLLGPEKNDQVDASESVSATTDASSERPALQRRPSHALSFQSLAIFFFSTIQTISGACLAILHAYKHALGTIKKVNQSKPLFSHQPVPTWPPPNPPDMIPGSLSPLTPMPPSAVPILLSPPSLPPSPEPSRGTSTISSIPSSTRIPKLNSPAPLSAPAPLPPDYVYPSLQFINTLLSSSPRNMSVALMHVLNLVLSPFHALLSRLLPYMLYTHAFSGDMLVNAVRSAKGALFPGGWPAVPPPDPTPEEQVELRKEVARRLLAIIPAPVQPVLGSGLAARMQTMEGTLEPLSSQECNAHLVVFLLDLVLLTLFPEMGVNEGTGGIPVEELSTSTPGSLNSVQSLMGDFTPPQPESRPS